MELHDAAALLKAEGLAYIISETKPPKKELTEGALRVIRIGIRGAKSVKDTGPSDSGPETEGVLELTVCRI